MLFRTPVDIDDLLCAAVVEGRALSATQARRLIDFDAPPAPECCRPNFCGGFSQLGLCVACKSLSDDHSSAPNADRENHKY